MFSWVLLFYYLFEELIHFHLSVIKRKQNWWNIDGVSGEANVMEGVVNVKSR